MVILVFSLVPVVKLKVSVFSISIALNKVGLLAGKMNVYASAAELALFLQAQGKFEKLSEISSENKI